MTSRPIRDDKCMNKDTCDTVFVFINKGFVFFFSEIYGGREFAVAFYWEYLVSHSRKG